MASETRKDLYSVVLPLYHFSKILGLTPFTLDGKIGARNFEVSYLGLTYSIVIGIVSIICHSLFLFYDSSEYFSEKVFLAASNLQLISQLSLTLLLYVMLFIKNRSILNIINKLSNINKIHKNDSYRIWHIVLLCWIFIIFSTHISVTVTYNLLVKSPNIYLRISQNSGSFSFVIFNIVEIHFINIMFLLKKYFSTINSTICDVMNEFHSSEVTKHLKKVKDLNLLSKIVNSTKRKLKYLKELHCDISNIAEYANSTYNMKILFIVADKFCIFLSNTYFTTVTILNYDRGPFDSKLWDVTVTIMMCVNMLQFVLILWYSSTAANEVSSC